MNLISQYFTKIKHLQALLSIRRNTFNSQDELAGKDRKTAKQTNRPSYNQNLVISKLS